MRYRTKRAAPALLALATASILAAPARADATPPSEQPPVAPPHPRGELLAALGAQGGSSAWPDDPIALTTLKIAWRFQDFLAPYVMGRTGYASINQRSILTLAIGAQAWARLGVVRPYVRASLIHQHEESLPALQADPSGALFGVGDGIRHRYGGDFAAGVDLPLRRTRQLELFATIEAVADWLPDPRGPSVYALGSLALGVSHAFF